MPAVEGPSRKKKDPLGRRSHGNKKGGPGEGTLCKKKSLRERERGLTSHRGDSGVVRQRVTKRRGGSQGMLRVKCGGAGKRVRM